MRIAWLGEKRCSWKPEGTRTLLSTANAAGVKRFVIASSGGVYPENPPGFLPITEDHPLRLNSPYCLSKLLGEELLRFYQRSGTLETVMLRFSHTQDADELLDEDCFLSGPRFFLKSRIRQQENIATLLWPICLNPRIQDILPTSCPSMKCVAKYQS